MSSIRRVQGSLVALALLASCQHRGGSGADEEKRILSVLREQPESLSRTGLADRFDAVPGGLTPHFSSPPARGIEAKVVLPGSADAPLHIEDAATGLGIAARLMDARATPARAVAGYVVYPQAHATGATVLHRPLPDGTEDYLSFDRPPASADVSYEITLGAAARGLRLVATTLEVLDQGGVPRLRVAAPYVVGADGARTDAAIVVEGCAVDRSPAPPWGRAVTPPGASLCRLHVTWPNDAVVYPAVLDPRWTTTGSMSVARQDHVAIRLSTGKVLVAGGRSTSAGTTALATAELYDPSTGTWAATGSMSGARFSHTATQLNTSSNGTTSGKVLVAGGINGTTSLSTAELYSPSAGNWTAAANLNAARHLHTATLMPNGNVLCAGGMNGTTVLATAAIYNPASGTGTWTAVATNMASARRSHTATLLASSNTNFNNKILVVGGNSGGTTSLTSVQLFDTTALTWSTTTALATAREGQTATTLANGNVLVTGGKSGTTTLATAFVYTIPASGTAATWASAGTMVSARSGQTATLLPSGILANGSLLVAGGSSGSASLATAELWNGATTWTATTALPAAVQGHTATLLANGGVLIAGGTNGTTTVGAADLYDASFALACTSNAQCVTGFCVSGVCCDTACNGGCGVCNLTGKVGTCSAASSGTTCRAAVSTCDVAETCNGTSLTCPTDGFAPATTVCRAAAGQCDIAENCTGTSSVCPADAKMGNGMACPDDGNPCTTDTCNGTSVLCQHPAGNNGTACPDDGNPCTTDRCDGVNTTCQHAAGNNGTACPDDGNPCTTDTCNGISTVCQHPAGNNGTACPDDGNPCTTDRCNGTSTACQHAAGNTGVTCRPSAGACDVAETCTGTSTSCPADTFLPATTVCRAAAGECDLAETCTGSSAACPADAKKAGGTACADDGNVCTTDRCDGSNVTCQHAAGNAGVVCRAAVGECDVAETCSGTSTACPADGKKAAGAACTDDGNACTTDRCDGSNVVCQHAAGNAGAVCRAAAGECDLAETCSGTSTACPADARKASGTACTDDGNACTADRCDGSNVACQHPAGNPGAVCRAVAGACDVAETCTGTSTACPADGFLSPTTVCRPATSACDLAESCTGTGPACPTDVFRPNGTTCSDGNACTQNDTCQMGACAPGSPVTCPAGDQCHLAGTCNPMTGVCSQPARPDGTSCNDGNACTRTDTCHTGVCVGANPVVCAAADACHAASTCDPGSGVCLAPPITSDSCQIGVFDYDKAGRLIRDRQAKLTYDGYDQLRTVTSTGAMPALVNLPVEEIGKIGGMFSSPRAINSRGHVAGYASMPDGTLHAFVYLGSGKTVDVNAATGISGSLFGAGISSADVVGGDHFTPSGAVDLFTYSAAQGFQDLGPGPAGTSINVQEFNDAGQFTGSLSLAGGAQHGFRYTPGVGYEDIGTLGGTNSFGFDIDVNGNVLGSSQVAGSPTTGFDQFGHAVLYNSEVQLVDLNRYVDPTTGLTLVTTFRSGGNWISGTASNGARHVAYRLNLATAMVDPVAHPSGGSLFGYGINSYGELVGDGNDDNSTTSQFAFIFTDQLGYRKLNDFIDPTSGWVLVRAIGIDDDGDVIGTGTLNGQWASYILRLPLRSASGSAPTVAVAHSYGYDGLRTSTTNAPGTSGASVQFFYTQDYTEHNGQRDHYVRIGDRIVAKVSYKPPPGGAGTAVVRAASVARGDGGDLVAKILVCVLLGVGLAASAAGVRGKKRRPAWVAATAGPVMLFFVASCEMFGLDRRESAQTVWQRIETVFFHHGVGAGPVLTTNADGSLREERRYEPFGQPIDANVGGTIGPIDFRREQQNSLGKMTDPATGWSYHGARWMQPQTARWTAPDPALFGPPRDFWHSNPYQYVSGNPLLLWDRTGGYDEVVHGALTYKLAIYAGFSPDQAAKIALSAGAVDHDPKRRPLGPGLAGKAEAVRKVADLTTHENHFLPPDEAMAKVKDEMSEGQYMGLQELGSALHTLQDVGFADAPGPHARGFHLFGDLGGHGFYLTQNGRGSDKISTPFSHAADQAFNDRAANAKELTRVYGVLKDAARAYGIKAKPNDRAAQRAINDVVNADTKEKIRDYYTSPVGDAPSYADQVDANNDSDHPLTGVPRYSSDQMEGFSE